MAHNLASRHHLRIAHPTSPIHLQRISRTSIARRCEETLAILSKSDNKRIHQISYLAIRLKRFFLPAGARRYLTFPSPADRRNLLVTNCLKSLSLFLFHISTNYRTKPPQITEQNRHKLPILQNKFAYFKKKKYLCSLKFKYLWHTKNVLRIKFSCED